MSAHSMSDISSDSTFRSTSLRSQLAGSNAETVNRPSGGKAHRLPSKGSAYRKLQYVSGNSGLISKTFIITPPYHSQLGVLGSNSQIFSTALHEQSINRPEPRN